MARLQTQLFRVSSAGFTWADNININNATALFRNNGSDSWTFEDLTNVSTPLSDTTLATNGLISLLNDGLRRDDFDVESGIYIFEDGKSNRFQTATINATNTTYNLTTSAANIYTITLDGVVYKFNLNNNGFGYYVNDKYRGSLNNQGAASSSFNNGLNCYFTLSQHKGKLIFATSVAGDYYTATGEVVFDGYLPFLLGSDATPTPDPEPQPSTDIPDIITDAHLTSDIFRTTSDGKKYYLGKALKFSSTDNSIVVTTADQSVNIELNPSQVANFLTSADVADFLTEAQVSGLITSALEAYPSSTAIQDLIADFLKASDLGSLSVDVKTTGNIEGNIIKAGTTIQFADGSTIKAIN